MKEYEKIKLAVSLDASDFSEEVTDECTEHDISTHYQNDSFSLDWKDGEDLPIMQEWLLDRYGEEIKKYNTFSVLAT
jgi:hypothetical protein